MAGLVFLLLLASVVAAPAVRCRWWTVASVGDGVNLVVVAITLYVANQQAVWFSNLGLTVMLVLTVHFGAAHVDRAGLPGASALRAVLR